MDPTTTLTDILADLKSWDDQRDDLPFADTYAYRNSIVQSLHALAEWIDDGGFPPRIAEAIRDADLRV